MASNKAALKLARIALEAQKYDEVINRAKTILASDEQNITAYVFNIRSKFI